MQARTIFNAIVGLIVVLFIACVVMINKIGGDLVPFLSFTIPFAAGKIYLAYLFLPKTKKSGQTTLHTFSGHRPCKEMVLSPQMQAIFDKYSHPETIVLSYTARELIQRDARVARVYYPHNIFEDVHKMREFDSFHIIHLN